MKKSAVLACGLLSLGLSSQAANITWVSFHPADNSPSGAGTSFTMAPDIGYTDLLRNAGHTVTRYVTTGTPDTTLLNASDLVIISRSVPSGDYELDAETAAWNGITAPTMILGGYIIRQSRLGYSSGSGIPDTVGDVKLTINNPAHPIFEGIALDGSNVMIDNYAQQVTWNVNGTNTLQRGISVVTNSMPNGTVLATTAAGSPAVNGMIIGEWQAGTTMTTSPADTLGGHRMVFLTGSREQGIPSQGAGIYDLTPTGAAMFLNAVDYMAVPEPSTYALFGLGAAALMFWRRKA